MVRKRKLLSTLLASSMAFTMMASQLSAIHAEESGIVKVSAVSDVSWCGNIPGYGTYPKRALKTVTLEYSSDVNETNLDVSDFTVADLDLADDSTMSIDAVNVSGKFVTLSVSAKESEAGVLIAPDGNFRRLKSDFKVTVNDEVKNTDGETLAESGDYKEFNQDVITNYASDEFQDLILKSDNSGNNIYVKYYLPNNYDASKSYPMVVHHTGGGQHYRTDTQNAEKYGENNFGVELDIDLTPRTFSVEAPEDTIMVTIQCLANEKPENYSPGKDINQVVKYFMDNYAVDTNRIYAIGNSQGGLDLSEAVYLHPEYYAAYFPCNTSIVMNRQLSDEEVYQLTEQYCQSYVDHEVAIWFHRGENDFTGDYDKAVTVPYEILVNQYKANGYTDEQIRNLVKQTKYSDDDFKAVGSTYYHGATGLMCLNTDAVNWLYQQTKAIDTESLVSIYAPQDKDGNKLFNTSAYIYDASDKMDEYTESVTNAPTYIIYPDHEVNEIGATNLLKELGMISQLDQYATKAIVVNPSDGYGEKDSEEWLKVLDTLVVINLKVIGIGDGATFVNTYVSQSDWAIAGIMTYGGEQGKQPKYSVPTYISGSSDTVVKDYIKANSATKQTEINKLAIYVNEDNEYERVVVNNNEESLASAFQNAWTQVLSKNGRIGNIGGTFYSIPSSNERNFEYTSFVDIARDGFTRNVVKQDLDGDGKESLWYEYLPENTLNAAEGSVPVVVMLHGNGNDPRTQFETSGFAKVAKENNIILIEPEWQGTLLGGKFDAMTESDSSTEDNDIIKMIDIIKEKYPQIDASRIYVEGLSRGGLNSVNLGITQSNTFAAVGSHSCGTKEEFYEILEKTIAENAENIVMPFYFIAGSKDRFIPILEYGETSQVLKTIQLYQSLNEMTETKFSELSVDKNKYFGMELDDYKEINNNGLCNIYGGTLSNENGVMLSLNAIDEWGHWNYEPDAELMWNFFSHYSRVDGTLYIDGKSTKPANDSTKPVVPDEDKKADEDVKPTDNKKSSASAKTSDNSNSVLYFATTIIAIGVAGVIIVGKKKHS